MKLFQFAFASLLLAATTLPTSAANTRRFEGWYNKTPFWGQRLRPINASYSEGRVIPLRFVASNPAGSVHTLRIKYDFAFGGGHFIDYLRSFDATESGVPPLGALTLPSDQRTPKTWPIPLDSSLNPPNSAFV